MHRHLFGQCLAAETFVARHSACSVCQGVFANVEVSGVEGTQDIRQDTWRNAGQVYCYNQKS